MAARQRAMAARQRAMAARQRAMAARQMVKELALSYTHFWGRFEHSGMTFEGHFEHSEEYPEHFLNISWW